MPRIVTVAWTTLAHICFVGGFASIAYFIYLSRHSPGSPLPSTGQTVELDNHGSLFYVRAWDAYLAQSGFVFVGILFVTVALLRWRYGKMPEVNDYRGSRLVVTAMVAAITVYMFWPIF